MDVASTHCGLTPDLGQPLAEFLLISRNVCSAVYASDESGLKWFICPSLNLWWTPTGSPVVYLWSAASPQTLRRTEITICRTRVKDKYFHLKPFLLKVVVGSLPWSLIILLFGLLFHFYTLILIELNSTIRDILIECRDTTSDSFYPHVSFCALRSWVSESTLSMHYEAIASVFSQLDFTHYPFCVTFSVLLQRSTPTPAAVASPNEIRRPENNAEWLNWNWTRLRPNSQPAQAYF